MSPRKHLYLVIAPLATAVLALAFAACGEEGAEAATVNVALSEWLIEPDRDSVPAGEVTFVAANEGTIEHELVIIKTDLADDSLPTHQEDQEMLGVVDEEAEGVQVIDEIEEFEPDGEESLTLDLEPGNYVLICNIGPEGEEGEHGAHGSHYEEGMHTSLTVE